MSKKCDVCNSKIGLLGGNKISDGIICSNCVSLCSSYKIESIKNMKLYYGLNNERKTIFKETQTLKKFATPTCHIDNLNRLFFFGDPKKNNNYIVYSFDEIVDIGYDIIEGQTTTKKKGGITRAVVGAAIAGPVGAVVGSTTAKEKVSKEPEQRIFYFNVKTYSGIKKISMLYHPNGLPEFLQKCIEEKNVNNSVQSNSIDEITKYKELLDKGIITEEEFSLKKKQILNI